MRKARFTEHQIITVRNVVEVEHSADCLRDVIAREGNKLSEEGLFCLVEARRQWHT